MNTDSPKANRPPATKAALKEISFSNLVLLLKRDREVFICALLVWFFLQVALVAIHEIEGVPYYDLTGDLVALAKKPAWLGFISQAGLIFWSAAASFCALSFAALRGSGLRGAPTNFLLATAGFSAVLLMDDAYVLHEQVLPHFGIPQIGVLMGYVVLAFAYVWCFRRAHISSNYVLLLAAMGGLGVSLLSDATHLYLLDPHLFEDSFKLFGVAFWAAYCFSISRSALTEGLARKD